jgi:hypothetical protein
MDEIDSSPKQKDEAFSQLQLEVLGLRDSLFGANVRAATAEWRLELAENRIKSMTKAVKNRNDMLNSVTWKAGRILLWPLTPVRYLLNRMQSGASK